MPDKIENEDSLYLFTGICLSETASWFMAAREIDTPGVVITEKMIDGFIKNFKDNVRRCKDEEGNPTLDIDYEHKEDPTYGMDAAGWIEDLEKRTLKEDGKDTITLWIKPKQWTPKAQEAIKTGAKKYFSIEYAKLYKDKETKKVYENVLLGGGLTNRPYIQGLAPVACSAHAYKKLLEENDKKTEKGVNKMNEKLKALLLQLNVVKLSENATDDYAIDKLSEHIKTMSAKVDESVKLTETLTAEKNDLTVKLSEATKKADEFEVIALSSKKIEAEKSLEGKMTPAELKDESDPIVIMLKEKKYDMVIKLAAKMGKKLKDKETPEPDGDEEEEKLSEKWDDLEPGVQEKKTKKLMAEKKIEKYAEAANMAKKDHNEKMAKLKEKETK